MRPAVTVVATMLVVSAFASWPASAAPPEGACMNAAEGREPRIEEPWPQNAFDPESVVWPHSTGKDVLVAVIDSGVDADHPQLKRSGKVLRGQDFFMQGVSRGDFDCGSHGTAVASIIAADPVDGIGFAGLAPDARILPVRITERDIGDGSGIQQIEPTFLAKGIRYAADRGAKVINLSLAGLNDSDRVRAAVKYAQRKDAVVVAAVGAPAQNEPAGLPSYPASYPGVLGVAAVDPSGQPHSSRLGAQADVVAPGAGVLGATRATGHDYWEGSSFAAPFVSATAALVRAEYPKLTAERVVARIMATTSPGRGRPGMINPYRAVTDRLTGERPVPISAAEPPYVDPEHERAVAWWQRTGTIAMASAGVLTIAAVLALVLVPALRRARRRRWQAGRAAPVPTKRVVEGPPDEVFIVAPPKAEQ